MSFELVSTVYGELPAKLRMEKLSAICGRDGVQTGPFGSQLHKEDYVPKGTPIITVEHLGENRIVHENLPLVSDADKIRLSKYLLQAGDIVFSRVGSVDRRALVQTKEDGWLFSGRCLRVRPNQAVVDSQWLSYFFGLPGFKNYIRSIAVGATMPSLNTRILSDLPIYFPTLDVQKNAAETLGCLDDRIALLRETNATLEAIAQSLFKSWFVDFDPVRAKLEGGVPAGMDDATAKLFPDSFDESELGTVPKGWQIATLADAFDINPKRSLKKSVSAPYLDMASLSTSGHCVEAPIQRDMSSGAKFRNGDTLLARITPCLENGKSAFVDFLEDDQVGWGSTEFLVLRPKKPLPEYFGYLLCRHPEFREYAIQSMSGTSGRQRVQNDVLGRYMLAVPDENVASAFARVVELIQKSIAVNHKTGRSLAALRDTLLPRLISGQLRLPEAETILEKAIA